MEIVVGLFVGEEEEKSQQLAVDAARGRHACSVMSARKKPVGYDNDKSFSLETPSRI